MNTDKSPELQDAISFDDFMGVELRVGTVIEAAINQKAKKCLCAECRLRTLWNQDQFCADHPELSAPRLGGEAGDCGDEFPGQTDCRGEIRGSRVGCLFRIQGRGFTGTDP